MKIIFPVNGQLGENMRIANSFHNTELACIYDTVKGSLEWVATKNMIREAALDVVLKQNEISVVITRNMPLMALGFFTDNGLNVYQADGENILENIELFHQNRLLQLTNSTAKMSSVCSGSCGTCNTTCKS